MNKQQREARQYKERQYEERQREARQYEANLYEQRQRETRQHEAGQREAMQYEERQREARQYEIARDLHNHVEAQATLAVMKSTVLLAAHALLFSGYVQIGLKLKVFARPNYTYADALFILSGLLILAAFLVSLRSIWPRITPSEETELIFFAGIQTYLYPREFVKDFNKLTEEQLKSMLLSNIHGKSVWLYITFHSIRVAICSSAAGTVLCVVAVCLIGIPDTLAHDMPWLLRVLKY
jgi:hypothetical protein